MQINTSNLNQARKQIHEFKKTSKNKQPIILLLARIFRK